jgi:hypothetical protein
MATVMGARSAKNYGEHTGHTALASVATAILLEHLKITERAWPVLVIHKIQALPGRAR